MAVFLSKDRETRNFRCFGLTVAPMEAELDTSCPSSPLALLGPLCSASGNTSA